MHKLLIATVTCLLFVPTVGAETFYGIDPGAGPGMPRPNADAAAAAFSTAAGALGPITTIDFEGLPFGDFDFLEVYPGIMAELAGTDPTGSGGISADPPTGASILGYNTTPGGEKHVGVWPIFDIGTCYLRFSFSAPIQAFGAYITGLEEDISGDLEIEFVNGTTITYDVPGSAAGQYGGVLYFGATEPATLISAATLRLSGVYGTREIFGVDDVSFVYAEALDVESTSWGAVKSLYR